MLPISIAGWGVREATMGLAFGYAGLKTNEGVNVSLLLWRRDRSSSAHSADWCGSSAPRRKRRAPSRSKFPNNRCLRSNDQFRIALSLACRRAGRHCCRRCLTVGDPADDIARALAKPNARSSHRIPTPQGAGIAVIAATLIVSGRVHRRSCRRGALIQVPLAVFGATLFIAVGRPRRRLHARFPSCRGCCCRGWRSPPSFSCRAGQAPHRSSTFRSGSNARCC